MSKNVLVTGYAGFLGSHLMLHHLRAGDVVYGIDNYSSSNRYSAHTEMIMTLGGFVFNADISKDFLKLTPHSIGYHIDNHEFPMQGGKVKFDLIYNFACPASPPIYQKIPVETMLTCVVGTQNILRLAQEHNAIVVQASTSEIYGDPESEFQRENYRGCVNPYGPRACYDEGKRAAEALCFDYKNKYDVDARVVRIFNTYGPHMNPRDGRVITNFVSQALENKPITVYGDGSQSRSFCYVDDLISAIVKMGSLEKNPNTPINIGNPVVFTMKELAELVVEKIGKGTIIHESLPVDDPAQRCPVIELAKEHLDWKPTIQLSEGLDLTISWIKDALKTEEHYKNLNSLYNSRFR